MRGLRAAAAHSAARGAAALLGAALLGLGTMLHAGVGARPASLVTAREAAASAKAFAAHPEAEAAASARHGYLGDNGPAPILDVLTPKAGLPAKPPFDVRVVARPPEGLGIDRSSIRIRYGFFKIDITKRMLALGRWEGNEFVVHQANAPAGTHWFYVTLADTAHHQATVSLKVIVE